MKWKLGNNLFGSFFSLIDEECEVQRVDLHSLFKIADLFYL